MKIERYLSQHDAALLSRIAERLLRVGEVNFNAGEALIKLISNSILLPENARRDDCVSLYSEVVYTNMDTNERRTVTVVCPQDANQALAQVSVLAPMALAMIGRKVGSIVEVRLPFDKVQFVKILEVREATSEAAEDEGGLALA